MSWGVMRIGTSDSLPEAVGQDAQRAHEERLEEVNGEDHDHQRQVDAELVGRQPPADRPQEGLGHVVQEAHDGVGRVRIHPRQDRARDDDPEVRVEHELDEGGDGVDEVAGDEHYAGPRPSSRERSVARSTARMNVVRMPPSSRAAMPAMVVPPGDDTISLSAPGCSPVSASRRAAPSTVWVASVIAVARSRPIFTPPSASDSTTSATYAGPEPESPVTASI